jgi:putative tricarboxylic transport membrane protein
VTIDRVLGGLLILLAAGVAWHAQTLVVPFAADPVGPRVFPTIVAAVLGLSGLALVIRPGPVVAEFGAWPRAVAIALASLVYPLLLQPLGFVPATALLCFVSALAFKGKPVGAAVAAIITAIAFFILLDRLLDLPLPRGPLGM